MKMPASFRLDSERDYPHSTLKFHERWASDASEAFARAAGVCGRLAGSETGWCSGKVFLALLFRVSNNPLLQDFNFARLSLFYRRGWKRPGKVCLQLCVTSPGVTLSESRVVTSPGVTLSKSRVVTSPGVTLSSSRDFS
ncbi:hypothetical protein AAMO2058_001193300 [Amorphochlora amoebiformis]